MGTVLGHQIDRISLLKVDAEGHDLAVLIGASEHLRAKSIEMVQFEHNWRWIESRCFFSRCVRVAPSARL